MKIDWIYMRGGCTSCDKAKEVLRAKNIESITEVDCKRTPLDGAALKVALQDLDTVWITKGKKVLRFTPPQDESEILALALGRSGNLRAPSIRHGRNFLVGYTNELYPELVDGLLRNR